MIGSTCIGSDEPPMNQRRGRGAAWSSYLDSFHADQPGITEAVLARCHYDGTNPYDWVLSGIPSTGTVLDLGCGSAPTYQPEARLWAGVDRSATELAAGHARGVPRLGLADASSLPFAAHSFDTVVCAMALMLFAPLSEALREIHRVLRPHGAVHALLPATRPLTVADRVRLGRLFAALHSRHGFLRVRFAITPGAHSSTPGSASRATSIAATSTRFAHRQMQRVSLSPSTSPESTPTEGNEQPAEPAAGKAPTSPYPSARSQQPAPRRARSS
jgi:SAM-dependent methyltransferase